MPDVQAARVELAWEGIGLTSTRWLNVTFLASFSLSVLTGFALTTNAYAGAARPVRFAGALVALNVLRTLIQPRFVVQRELILYLLLIGYMVISLLWTEDFDLGIVVVLLSANFALIMILLGALFAYHDLTAVLKGLLVGFLLGAAYYFSVTRFPLVFPEPFSYNTMAGMYLFGLFVTVACGWFLRSRIMPIGLGLVLLLHVAATTSIKTNLGIALGAAAAGLAYFRHSLRLLWRNFIILVAFFGIAGYIVLSNKDLTERLLYGATRVSTGAEILTSREEDTGHIGLDTRQYWTDEGLKGWRRSPLLGNGTEAFRADYGITSHSTPIDLLYNSGIIGFGLFYSLFVSVAWRVHRARLGGVLGFQALTLAGLTCYAFMSVSGTLYYDTFVAAFLAITAAVLARATEPVRLPPTQSAAAASAVG
jgi:hypothetical protein